MFLIFLLALAKRYSLLEILNLVVGEYWTTLVRECKSVHTKHIPAWFLGAQIFWKTTEKCSQMDRLPASLIMHIHGRWIIHIWDMWGIYRSLHIHSMHYYCTYVSSNFLPFTTSLIVKWVPPLLIESTTKN